MTAVRSGRRLTVLPVFLLAVAAVAVIGSLASVNAGDTYLALERPAWAPPSWLFGPAWTVLYVMIGVSGWLAWSASGWSNGMTAYAVQLVLNALWTPLFFGAEKYGLAFAEILLLWLAIITTILLFWRPSRTAALLLLPYLAWVTYAGALNLSIWQLN